jgi:hypothetical protein
MDNQSAPRTIKIGSGSVGLLGLDQALQKAVAKKMTEEEAVDFLYRAVAEKNYVPDTASELYRAALRREYRKRTGLEADDDHRLDIRILGPDCVSCNRLRDTVFDLMQRLDLVADIEKIQDPDEIYRFGELRAPALIINGKVKCAGRLPSPAQVEEWLREAAEEGSR